MPRRKRGNDHTRSPQELERLTRKHLELDPTQDAWEQQPAETTRNYGYFTMYRDMGRLRSVAQVATMGPLTYRTLSRVSQFNKWVERAGLWDAEQDRITSIRLQGAREEMAKHHAKGARLLFDKALERLKTINVNSISPTALVMMFEAAARIERAALGLDSMGKGQIVQPQTSVTVAASTKTNAAGDSEMRVEVGVQHDQIMATLDEMVARMGPEQIAAGYQELAASAVQAVRELDAALPAPPPQ